MPADIIQTSVFSTPSDALHPFNTAPTLAAGANNGTSPPAPTLVTGASDYSGAVNFGSGTTPAAGAQVVVTFGTPWQGVGASASKLAPTVFLTSGNSGTGALGALSVSSVTNTGFTINCATAPAGSQSVGTYVVNYVALD